MSGPLHGRTALVTGGAVRVGAAISRGLAAAGAGVAVHYHSHDREARAIAEACSKEGVEALSVQGDLTDPGHVRQVFDAVEAALGPVDLLVNNAGVIATTPLDALEPDVASALFAVNGLAPLYTMAELARRDPPRAAIVNIVDTSADRAWARHAAYCGSKMALLAMTRVAARELAPNIRVNAVNPGTVVLRDEERAELEGILERIPLGAIGAPADVAAAVVYLASARYVTGAVLAVDGGSGLSD